MWWLLRSGHPERMEGLSAQGLLLRVQDEPRDWLTRSAVVEAELSQRLLRHAQRLVLHGPAPEDLQVLRYGRRLWLGPQQPGACLVLDWVPDPPRCWFGRLFEQGEWSYSGYAHPLLLQGLELLLREFDPRAGSTR